MFQDKHGEFSNAQAITGDGNSTNVIDLGVEGRDIGKGEQLYIAVSVDTTFDSAGEAATLQFILETDNDVAFGSATTIWQSATIAEATLVAGYVLYIPIPSTTERYLRLRWDNGTEAFTAGAITARITVDKQEWSASPDAIDTVP